MITCSVKRFANSGMGPLAMGDHVPPPSLEPSSVKLAGSRSGASFADVRLMPLQILAPRLGVTVKPVFSLSKFKYFVLKLLSITLLTTSFGTGEFGDVGVIGSPGAVISAAKRFPPVLSIHAARAHAVNRDFVGVWVFIDFDDWTI